jgi:hypothetical protein
MRPTRRSASHPASALALPHTARRRPALPLLVLVVAAALTAIAASAGAIPASAGAAANPVLGSKAFTGSVGNGFGTAEPSAIFNGGDPSGSVTKIHWTGWGSPSAIGYGLNPIFKPRGGYYAKPARIELRATDLGKCGNRAAYTRLEIRVPKHPGGKLGKWLLWSGAKTICKPPY